MPEKTDAIAEKTPVASDDRREHRIHSRWEPRGFDEYTQEKEDCVCVCVCGWGDGARCKRAKDEMGAKTVRCGEREQTEKLGSSGLGADIIILVVDHSRSSFVQHAFLFFHRFNLFRI